MEPSKRAILLGKKLDTQKSECENKLKELIKKISLMKGLITEKINELNIIEEGLKK